MCTNFYTFALAALFLLLLLHAHTHNKLYWYGTHTPRSSVNCRKRLDTQLINCCVYSAHYSRAGHIPIGISHKQIVWMAQMRCLNTFPLKRRTRNGKREAGTAAGQWKLKARMSEMTPKSQATAAAAATIRLEQRGTSAAAITLRRARTQKPNWIAGLRDWRQWLTEWRSAGKQSSKWHEVQTRTDGRTSAVFVAYSAQQLGLWRQATCC